MPRSPRISRFAAAPVAALLGLALGSNWLMAPAARAESEPLVSVIGGALAPHRPGEIDLWANSPTAALTIQNPNGRFYRSSVRWHNVTSHSFLLSPQGVADAPSRSGSMLVSRVLISAGGSASWRLDPNLKGDYTFVVASGPLSGLEAVKPPCDFALHLGNAGQALGPIMSRLEGLAFPTYVLPGSKDVRRGFEERTGEVRRDFAIERDRFLVIDNADGHVGPQQRAWVANRLAAFRAQHARNIFVFMHWPVFDPRPRRHAEMSRRDARALHAIFKYAGVTAIFAGQVPSTDQVEREGLTYRTVGKGAALQVKVLGAHLSIQPL